MLSEPGAEYKIEILDMALLLRNVRLTNDVYNALVSAHIQCGITRVDIKESRVFYQQNSY